MKKLLIAVGSAIALCLGIATPATAIVGGYQDSSSEGWIGSLQTKDAAHGCTTSLIHPEWALIAHHCVANLTDLSIVQVRFGSNDHKSGGVVTGVSEVHFPESAGTFRNDIAVMRLSTPVHSITPGVLADVKPRPWTPVKLTGWGIRCNQSFPPAWYCEQPPAMRHSVNVHVVDDWQCTSIIGGIDAGREICTGGYFINRGACYGDSGGPAIVGGRIAGVTSRTGQAVLWGHCGNIPTIYTDVATHRGWIASVTGV